MNDLKRPAPLNHSPHAKRHASPQHISSVESSDLHIRVLIESSYCARILGAKGLRLRDLKWESDDTRQLNAWVSPDAGFEFRILHVTGSPLTVAKFFGLFVRALFDEDPGPSTVDSRFYDLKMLVPHPLMGKLIGTRMAVFKDIETKSAARLSADRDKLPRCDDRIVHIYGVGDAVHIATFHVCEIFANNPQLFRASRLVEYIPSEEPLDVRRKDRERDRDRDRGSPDPSSVRHREPSLDPPAHFLPPKAPALAAPATAAPASTPLLPVPTSLPLRTAFETAKESKRPSLKQIIKVPTQKPRDALDTLIDNMKRVTECTVTIVDEDECALQIDGPPEDNALAIFLAWRYAR